MDERYVQAGIRFVIALILGAVGAGAANYTILSSLVSDPIYSTIVVAVIFGVLNFISKAVGGPTVPSPINVGLGAAKPERPNPLSV
ncbi:MAG TPA: hypothetical protein VFX15_02965 [Actinomycetes bacterium]|nr:hypothetical protein [Actinomycetes bacterium]